MAAAILVQPSFAAAEISGRAEVIDGDTVAVEGTKERIRLYGIDAPESGQTCIDGENKTYLCGVRSANHLATLVGRNGRLVCIEEDRDRYGRIVAECSNADGQSVNAEMISDGWAIEYTQYSGGRYSRHEAEARERSKGMWVGQFVRPWEWRRGKRLSAEITLVAAPERGRECAIKGNINRKGERIYHLPSTAGYEATKIEEASGERWFCSEQEAAAAGWRARK